MQFAERIRQVQPSITLAVTAKAKALRAKGEDIIAFGAGEPDFDTPSHIKDAAIKALEAGQTRYLPAAGLPALRQAVAELYARTSGLPCLAENVAIATGGKFSIYCAAQVLLNPGDEVIIPAPYWVSYPDIALLAGAKPVILETTAESGFRVTPEQLRAAITDRTKMVIINSPSNPTGSAYTRAELAALAAVLLDRDIWILADEIYEFLVYDGFEFVSFPAVEPRLIDRTIVASGASKTFAMTGWRIGWTIAPKSVTDMIARLMSQSTSNVTSFAQYGALAAVTGSFDFLDEMKAAFVARRNAIVDRLNAIPGVTCAKPEGAFYVFPRVDAYYGKHYGDRKIGGSADLCDYLLDVGKVACVPGVGFGADPFIRLSYATSMDQIVRGMDRIVAALAALAD